MQTQTTTATAARTAQQPTLGPFPGAPILGSHTYYRPAEPRFAGHFWRYGQGAGGQPVLQHWCEPVNQQATLLSSRRCATVAAANRELRAQCRALGITR